MVTDTVHCDAGRIPSLEVVPSAELSARIIMTIMTNSSMTKMLRPFSAQLYFRSPKLFNQIAQEPGP
jgi:ribose-phosphate pyrophosphokinase